MGGVNWIGHQESSKTPGLCPREARFLNEWTNRNGMKYCVLFCQRPPVLLKRCGSKCSLEIKKCRASTQGEQSPLLWYVVTAVCYMDLNLPVIMGYVVGAIGQSRSGWGGEEVSVCASLLFLKKPSKNHWSRVSHVPRCMGLLCLFQIPDLLGQGSLQQGQSI